MGRKSIYRTLVMVILLGQIFIIGCVTTQNPYTYQGAGLGAAVGTALGAATNGKNPWKGAAIGALLGGSAGYIAGEMYGRANPYPPQQGYYNPGPSYGYAPHGAYQPAYNYGY